MNESPKCEVRSPKSAIRYPLSAIRNYWSWPLAVPVMLGIFSVWVVLMLLAVGCQTDRASLEKYQAEYKAATNTLNIVHTAVQPYVPPPVNTATEGVFAIVTGLLAAWNTWQHRQISLLKNGHKNGNGTSAGSTPATPGPSGG
jgi:hypothetical protein